VDNRLVPFTLGQRLTYQLVPEGELVGPDDFKQLGEQAERILSRGQDRTASQLEALGATPPSEQERRSWLRRAVDLIVTTHRHRDHWQALEEVVGRTGAPTAAHVLDAPGIPVATVDQMKAALAEAAGKGNNAARQSNCVVYPDAPHAFHADYRATFRKEPAEDGFRRALEWFRSHGLS
jgi:hypothetical protein